MSDNITAPLPDGTVLAFKDLSSVKYSLNMLADWAGADVLGLVSANGTVTGNLKAISVALATPFQAGGSIGNTAFGAKLQDANGAAFGTVGNPIYVTGGGGGGGGGAVTAVSGAYVAGSIVDIGTGVSPAANTLNARLATINTTLGTPLQAGGTVNVGNASLAVTGTFWQATQPISASALPLPAGASTSALQTTGNTSLASILAALGTPFQAAGSITNITGTVSLPTGAATATLQGTGNTSLASILAAVLLTTPGDDLFAITPGVSALGTIPKALIVTVAGTLAIGGTSNVSVPLGSVTVGQVIPIRARYVYATGTTATVVGVI